MRCLTDQQLERLAAAPDDAAPAPQQTHLRQCATCRQKLEQTRADAALIDDIRDLREHREKIKPLFEKMSASTGSIVPPPPKPVR